jgi:SMI1-KNR4 cell-wall
MARFDEVKSSFWSDSDYGVQKALTDEAIGEAESILGVTLPSSLLELLRVQNGGVVADQWSAFPTSQSTSWAKDHIGFRDLMGISGTNQVDFSLPDQPLSLLWTPYLVEEWGLPSPVVLLSGDGHMWVALDYRVCGRAGEPAVAWFEPEEQAELPLAPDFRSFVEGLMPEGAFE